MSKRDVYIINMAVETKELHTLPEGNSGPIGIFYSVLLQVVVKWGEDKKGMDWNEHALFRQIRFKVEESVKTSDPKLTLEIPEYDFLKTVLKEARPLPQINEVFFRVGILILQAKKEEIETA